MLPEGPTAGTGTDGNRAAGLLLRLPMPARRREARRAWLPAEPERGLEKSKKMANFFSFFRAVRPELSHVKNKAENTGEAKKRPVEDMPLT